MSSGKIKNKIAEAGLITIDLLDFMPKSNPKPLDLKDWLFKGLIVKESHFKKKLDDFNPSTFKDHYVYIHCSKNVIIPTWAFLLLQIKLSPFAKYVFFGNRRELSLILFKKNLEKTNLNIYKNKRVFLKGCGDPHLPIGAFSLISDNLIPIVKSLFYGEACSNVPLIKNM